MEVTSVFHKHTKWSQKQNRIWSPKMTSRVFPALSSYVVPRNDIAYVPQKCCPYVVPTTAIACGSQNCHRIWSTELTSSCLPHHCYHTWGPELTSVCVPHSFYRMWSQIFHRTVPKLPSSCGPQNWHPYAVPTTDILCDLRNWSEPSPSHNNYCLWRKSIVSCSVRRQLRTIRNCTSIKKVVTISTIFFGKHNRVFSTCRKVNSSLYNRPWGHIQTIDFKIGDNSAFVRMFCWL